MDPLKSLVKKKRLFSSFIKYDLLNQAAGETHLYSEEQGRELVGLARDNPVAASERLLNIIRVQSSYETFISTLERSIEIGHSQQRTVVDAQAHEQLINELVGEKKSKGILDKIKGSISFKTKEKKSKESESKRHFTDRDKDQADDPLMDASDLIDNTDSGHRPIPETASAIFDPRDICRRIPGAIHGEQMRQDSHYNHGGQPIPKDSQSWCDFSEYSPLPETIYEQDSRDRVSSVSKSDYKRRSLTRSQSYRKNQGKHSGVLSNNQPMPFDQNLMNVNENLVHVSVVDTGTGLQRTSSKTSLDFGMGKADSNIENLQREFQDQKKQILTLTEKVNRLEVVASRVEKQVENDQGTNKRDHEKLQDSIGNMGYKLAALESSGNKEGVRFQEELKGLQAKYQEMEKEKEKMKEKEEKLQEKIQALQVRQASLDANEKKQIELHQETIVLQRENERHATEQAKILRTLQEKVDVHAREQTNLRVEVAKLQVQPRSSHSEPQTQAVEQAKLEAHIQEQIKVYIQHIQSDVKVLHDKIKASETDNRKFQKDIEELQHTNSLLHSDVTAAENKLAQCDSRLKGTKEEMDKVSRQSATMQAKMSSREEIEGVSRELRLLIDKQEREINDLKERLGQSQEQIEQMGTRQKTVEGELQNQNQSIKSIHQKLPGNKDNPTEWDKLHKELEETGREMLKINKVTEKIESMEEDMNELRSQVEKQYDAVQTLSQTHKSGKPAEGNQAATGHMYIASLEERVMDMQESWEKKFEEFAREVRIDSEWILEIYQLFAKMNEVRGEIEASVLKRKRALQEKSNP